MTTRDSDRTKQGYQLGMHVVRSFTREGVTQEVQCEVIDPFSKEWDALLQCARLFSKCSEIRVHTMEPGQVHYTEQAATSRTARLGDVLAENPTGEFYVISAADLTGRYDPKPGSPGIYVARGIVRATVLAKHVLMKASWGEWLGAIAGDMLVERPDTGERYCIERKAFDSTYVALDGPSE